MEMPPRPTADSMNMGTIVYWHQNQVMLTLFSDLPTTAPAATINAAASAELNEINAQVLGGTSFQLSFQTPTQNPPTPTPMKMPDATQKQSSLLPGIYVYSAPNRVTAQRIPKANIAVFSEIVPMAMTTTTPAHPMANTSKDDPQMPDNTLQITGLINNYPANHNRFLATPNWLWSGVPVPIHGCPVSPPFPAEHSGDSGLWETTFASLPDRYNNAQGTGVNVFVLDAFPSPQQITEAAQTAGNQNKLLQSMATGMVNTAPFQATPPAISVNNTYAVPDPDDSAVTGKDIYGRLSGFPMADHGLFITGLIRDLAPAANIECIRILNDFAVGDLETLTQVLADIGGSLQNGNFQAQPVVINLSMVVGPPEADQAVLNGQSLPALLGGLRTQMQSLAALGVIFVASVGNDSDPRDSMMNPNEVRFGPRYPAAFAYENPPILEVLPVGALNRAGSPTIYSNYPGTYGLATMGGELPQPVPWVPSAMEHKIAQVDQHHLDALRGVYSSTTYPALSRNDHYPVSLPSPGGSDYPLYPAPQTNAWACWAGTSFAAPIMTALVARVLEGQTRPVSGQTIHDTITAFSGHTLWTGLENGPDTPGPSISVSQEWQER